MLHDIVGTIGGVAALGFVIFSLCAIGSAMMNGIAQSDMGKLMLMAIGCGVVATICLG